MIKHYILMSATFKDLEDGETAMGIDFDHSLLLSTFGGVAYDTENKVWLSPSQLSEQDSEEDSIFLNYVSHSIYNSNPD